MCKGGERGGEGEVCRREEELPTDQSNKTKDRKEIQTPLTAREGARDSDNRNTEKCTEDNAEECNTTVTSVLSMRVQHQAYNKWMSFNKTKICESTCERFTEVCVTLL